MLPEGGSGKDGDSRTDSPNLAERQPGPTPETVEALHRDPARRSTSTMSPNLRPPDNTDAFAWATGAQEEHTLADLCRGTLLRQVRQAVSHRAAVQAPLGMFLAAAVVNGQHTAIFEQHAARVPTIDRGCVVD